MAVRIKTRAILKPLAIYIVSAAAIGYFVYTAVNGDRGLKAKQAYQVEISRLNTELSTLKAEHAALEARNIQLRAGAIDKDLLEEEARSVLGRVHKNDMVIFVGKPAAN